MTRAALEESFTAFSVLFVLVCFVVDQFPMLLSFCCSRPIPFLMTLNALLEVGTVTDVPAFVVSTFEKINVIHELYCHVDTLPRKALFVRHAVQPRKNRSALTQQAT